MKPKWIEYESDKSYKNLKESEGSGIYPSGEDGSECIGMEWEGRWECMKTMGKTMRTTEDDEDDRQGDSQSERP